MGADKAPDKSLTERQQQILAFVRQAVRERGYPPSVREIGDAVGLRSTSSVHHQLQILQREGYLRRDLSRPRAIELRQEEAGPTGHEGPTWGAREVPLLGEVAAGAPIVAEEQALAHYPLPRDIVGEGTLFMLTVRGESMLEAGVLDGDFVVVRQQPTVEQGEMCAALIDDEATVKFYRRASDGQVFLDPANPAFEPIPLDATQQSAILGKVTAVLRRV